MHLLRKIKNLYALKKIFYVFDYCIASYRAEKKSAGNILACQSGVFTQFPNFVRPPHCIKNVCMSRILWPADSPDGRTDMELELGTPRVE